MSHPVHIDLQAGPGWRYRLLALGAWLLAAAVSIVHALDLGLPLAAAACAVLVLSRQGLDHDNMRHCRLSLYRNGTAVLDGVRGNWGSQTWACNWFSVLRIECDRNVVRVLVCASRNTADDYRRLLIWTRFRPFGTSCRRKIAGQG